MHYKQHRRKKIRARFGHICFRFGFTACGKKINIIYRVAHEYFKRQFYSTKLCVYNI